MKVGRKLNPARQRPLHRPTLRNPAWASILPHRLEPAEALATPCSARARLVLSFGGEWGPLPIFLQLESRPSAPKRPFMFLKPTNEDLREELNRSSSKLGPDCPTPHFHAPNSQIRRVETVLNAEDSEKGEGIISPRCPPRLQVLEHLTLPTDMLTHSH